MPPLYWKEMDRASKQEKSTGGSKGSLWKIFSEETSDMDKDISGHLHSLKSRKSDCEMLQAAGISEMMDGEIPNFEKVRELILWSQVYERIERAVDMVSDLGDTLEEVVLKYV